MRRVKGFTPKQFAIEYCPHCGVKFEYDRLWTKFCSKRCKNGHHNMKRLPHTREFIKYNIPTDYSWLLDTIDFIHSKHSYLCEMDLLLLPLTTVQLILTEMEYPPLIKYNNELNQRAALKLIIDTRFDYNGFEVSCK